MTDLEEVFQKQHELIKKYTPIEMENGRATDEHPVDLNTREGQTVVKDFCWRITEELIEANECATQVDYLEELSDVLHFATELCILLNIHPTHLSLAGFDGLILACDGFMRREDRILKIITQLGLISNDLKARPWKQDFDPPHIGRIQAIAGVMYTNVISLFADQDCSAEDIKEIYFDKNSINHKRVEGGY